MRAFCTGACFASFFICPLISAAFGGSMLLPILVGIGWAILANAHRPSIVVQADAGSVAAVSKPVHAGGTAR